MMIKTAFLGLILCTLLSFSLVDSEYVDPTGTYVLGKKVKADHEDVYGYYGAIQVKLINKNKIAMTFYICKGAPSYNSGSFVDTLDYIDKKAVHTFADSVDCVTEFLFNKKTITVVEKGHERACWGAGVVAHGVYKQTSNKMPILTDPLTDELIK